MSKFVFIVLTITLLAAAAAPALAFDNKPFRQTSGEHK